MVCTNMKKRIVSIVLVLVMALGLMSSASAELDTQNPIKIGFEAWCSGVDAYFGIVAQKVMEDYIEQVNENGGWLGRKVELITMDYSKDFSECVNATNKLIQMDCVAIVGPDGDPFAPPIAPLLEEAKVPAIGNGIVTPQSTLKEDGVTVTPYLFRTSPLATDGCEALARYIYNELGARTVATLTEKTNVQSVYMTEAFEKTFEELGGKVVAREGYELLASEFRAQLTNIMMADPEYLFMPAAAHKEVGNAAKQLAQLGNETIKWLGYDCWVFPELLDNAGPELEGSLIFTAADVESEMFDDVRALYESKHSDLNMGLHIWAIYALDALKVIENAILTTGSTDGEVLRDAIENTRDLPVTTGIFTNNPATHAPSGVVWNLMEIKGNAFVDTGIRIQ